MPPRDPLVRAVWVGTLLSTTACAPDLRDRLTRDNGDGLHTEDLAQAGSLDTGADLTEAREVVVDTTSETDWHLYDFERQGLVDADLPFDLSLQRYRIRLNGGVSGDGGVVAAVLDGRTFDDVTAADVPPDGDPAWFTDAADADGDGEDETAFDDWYAYDPATHILTAQPRVTLVRTVEGNTVKVEILDYYDDAGTPGFLRFVWAELAL